MRGPCRICEAPYHERQQVSTREVSLAVTEYIIFNLSLVLGDTSTNYASSVGM